MKLVALIGFLCFYLSSTAQRSLEKPVNAKVTTGKISGEVWDTKQKPLSYVAVALYYAKDSTLYKGEITGNKGDFSIETVLDSFYVQISFLGFKDYYSQTLLLSDKQPILNLERVILQEATELLEAVEVVEIAKAFKQELGKEVLDVEKAGLSDAEDALAVIRAVPGTVIEENGTIKSKTKSMTVFINGRPSGLTGDNQQMILSQIPANTIKSIEVLSNPSSKYTGTGGIINIVLRKARFEGITGYVGLNAGSQLRKALPMAGGSLGLNYKTEKLYTFFNLSSSFKNRESSSESLEQQFFGNQLNSIGLSRSATKNYSQYFRAGMDYFIDDKQSITYSAYGNRFGSPSDWNTSIYDFAVFNPSGVQIDGFSRENESISQNFRVNHELVYAYEFKDKDTSAAENYGAMGEKHELEVSLNINQSTNENLNNRFNSWFLADTLLRYNEAGFQETNTNKEDFSASFALNYTKPFKKQNARLEVGLSSKYRHNNNRFDFLYGADKNQLENDLLRSNNFGYERLSTRGYVNFNKKISDAFQFEAGLSVQYGYMTAALRNTSDTFYNNFLALMPRFGFQYKLNEKHRFSINFDRDFSLPYLSEMNPFPNYANEFSLRRGNPYLTPSYENVMNLDYNLNFGKNFMTLGLVYSFLRDQILNVKSVEDDVIVTEPVNIGLVNRLGVNMGTNLQLMKRWSCYIGVYGGQYSSKWAVNDDSLAAARYMDLSIYFSSRLRLKNDWSLNFYTSLSPASSNIQGRSSLYYWGSLSVSKKVLKKKGRLSLSVSNPIFTSYSSSTKTAELESSSMSINTNNTIKLRFTYNFGKVNIKNQRESRASQGSAASE